VDHEYEFCNPQRLFRAEIHAAAAAAAETTNGSAPDSPKIPKARACVYHACDFKL
jgi:hypothetical protein